MHYVPILSVPMMETIKAHERPVHMMLAQYSRVLDYRQYFQNLARSGKVVILDNGAYEDTRVSNDELISIAAEIRPSFVVVPDKVGDKVVSDELASDFMRLWKPLPGGVRCMRIFHGTGKQVVEDIAKFQDRFHGIGIPRCLRHEREYVVSKLQDYWGMSSPYIHLFGCWDKTVMEISWLSRYPHIRSLDTKLSYDISVSPDAVFDPLYRHYDRRTLIAHVEFMDQICRRQSWA
jgi:hypothetical protein